MASFHVGQKTDRAALPHRHALEPASADTPESRDETGRGRACGAPGVEQGRGETVAASPGGGGVTRASGDRGGNVPPIVFVLAKDGTPVQPTSPARARELLAKDRAVIHRHTPFVIRLKDRAAPDSTITGVELGIDPGSKHTGISVFTEAGGSRTGRFALQLDHRGGAIRDKLSTRAAYRRGRRTRNLRYRAPRFLNRTRPNGWLAPSLRHRVDTTMNWVTRLTRWAPFTMLHVERVSF